MAIEKKLNPNQHLIDKFGLDFSDYSIDARAARYLSAMLRLGNGGNHGVTSKFKIDVMTTLDARPGWARAAKYDFKRYFDSKKIEENNFNFIGESKYEVFFYNEYINNIINLNFVNDLPGGRNVLHANYSGAKLIFENVSFSNREKVIFFYDAWSILPHIKDINLKRLKSDAHTFLQLYDKCKWFDNKPEGLRAAHDHLKEFDANCGYFSDSDDLRIYFFKKYEYNAEKFELSIRKIQMLFNNRKSRATKATKQVNFSLSEKSIKNIKKLSLNHEENGSKIVDAIFKNDELIRYIDKHLKGNRSVQFSDNGSSNI